MLLLIVFAFLAGVVTIFSPCILPILPIVLSGAVGEGKRRPLGIVAGFILSFGFFTLTLAQIVQRTGLPADSLRSLAVVAIIGFGVSLCVPQTQMLMEKLMSKLAGLSPNTANKTGFSGGMLIGLSLGLIWAPCVGPILASVITLAVTSSVSFAAVFITLAYALGTGVPMLAITYGGRQLLTRVPWLLQNTAKIQRAFGVIMILTGMAIFFNVDRQFQAFILQKLPQYGAGLTTFENNALVQDKLSELQGNSAPRLKQDSLLESGKLASDFTGGGKWINSQPLSLKKELKGKVVLVDFWTYSCINCIRTFPYLKKWYETYKDQGFVIVGVHSPEFAFEKEYDNVVKATKDFGLLYPVVQDNDFNIWKAYDNQFWPAHYLIDQEGKIRYTHFGEGKYDETENAIRELLKQPPVQTSEQSSSLFPLRLPEQMTPETYLGWARAGSYFMKPTVQTDKTATYTFTQPIPENAVALQGDWNISSEYAMSAGGAKLQLDFEAKQVYLVLATSDGKPHQVKVMLDGQPLKPENITGDMNDAGVITVAEPRKYDIVKLPESGRHILDLEFDSGIQAFAFTFGAE